MDDPFRAVVERRPALLRTALLLTGDRRAAEELVQRALARAGRRPDAVLPALVRGATSRWARLVRAEQVIEALPDPFAAAGPDVPEPAGELRRLPARTRAVVVLRWHEGLADPAIARLLHCPVEAVRTEAARGLAALEPGLAPSGYERAAPEVPVEQLLTAELTRLAAAPGPWLLGPDAAVADVRARRSRTRRRLAAAAVAIAVIGIAVPVAGRAPDPPAPAASPSSANPTPPPSAARSRPVLTGPTRGSLAGDPAFLDEVRSVGWGAQDVPPPFYRDVVLATDTPDGRVALVVGNVLDDFRGVWLTGPVGAAATDLVPRVPRQLGRDRPVTLLLGGPGDGTLVVVAAPGDGIAVSDRLMTGPRGTVGRTYSPVEADDGVAVVPARTTSLGPALSVQVVRDGREVYRGAADWAGPGTAGPVAVSWSGPLRPGTPPSDAHLLDAALTDLALPLGVEPAALQPELLWSADLPAGAGSVAVLVAYSPGGALVVTTWAGVGGAAVGCGTQTPPGTTEVSTLTVARVCDVDDGRWLVFTAPPDAATAELLDARGRVVGPLTLTAGSALAPLPDGARTVRTLDAGGRPLRETPIAPSPTEPFGDFGSGPER